MLYKKTFLMLCSIAAVALIFAMAVFSKQASAGGSDPEDMTLEEKSSTSTYIEEAKAETSTPISEYFMSSWDSSGMTFDLDAFETDAIDPLPVYFKSSIDPKPIPEEFFP